VGGSGSGGGGGGGGAQTMKALRSIPGTKFRRYRKHASLEENNKMLSLSTDKYTVHNLSFNRFPQVAHCSSHRALLQ
jgi:hypothetical protein